MSDERPPNHPSRPRRPIVVAVVVALLLSAGFAYARRPSSSVLVRPGPVVPLAIGSPNSPGAGEFLLTTVAVEPLSRWAWLHARVFGADGELMEASRLALSDARTQRAAMNEAQIAARQAAESLGAPPANSQLDTRSVGGPSGGLMLALAYLDAGTPGDLTGGRKVAGTGTISPSGTVGAVGATRFKLAGARRANAEVFFVPRHEAVATRRSGASRSGPTVVPVSTLSDAVAWLCDHGATDQACASSGTESAPAASSRANVRSQPAPG